VAGACVVLAVLALATTDRVIELAPLGAVFALAVFRAVHFTLDARRVRERPVDGVEKSP
jgi:hypothetical protein